MTHRAAGQRDFCRQHERCVLEFYQRPNDPQRLIVRLDETTKQISGRRAPILAAPRRKRHDYEYERNGLASLFMMFAPLQGWRCTKVADRHAAADLALRSLPRCAGATARRTLRMALHAKTRKLARYGRNQTRRLRHTMPGSPHSRQADTDRLGRRLVGQSQPTLREGQLAIQNQRRSS